MFVAWLTLAIHWFQWVLFSTCQRWPSFSDEFVKVFISPVTLGVSSGISKSGTAEAVSMTERHRCWWLSLSTADFVLHGPPRRSLDLQASSPADPSQARSFWRRCSRGSQKIFLSRGGANRKGLPPPHIAFSQKFYLSTMGNNKRVFFFLSRFIALLSKWGASPSFSRTSDREFAHQKLENLLDVGSLVHDKQWVDLWEYFVIDWNAIQILFQEGS